MCMPDRWKQCVHDGEPMTLIERCSVLLKKLEAALED